jgi:hypothetical protein
MPTPAPTEPSHNCSPSQSTSNRDLLFSFSLITALDRSERSRERVSERDGWCRRMDVGKKRVLSVVQGVEDGKAGKLKCTARFQPSVVALVLGRGRRDAGRGWVLVALTQYCTCLDTTPTLTRVPFAVPPASHHHYSLSPLGVWFKTTACALEDNAGCPSL